MNNSNHNHTGKKTWMIYGANGYTGELIAREAKQRGLNPVLAGRDEKKVRALATELGFKSVAFDLSDTDHIGKHISGMHTVLHCAGPFSATAAPMMSACLHAKVNYLDITGEIAVFEHGNSLHAAAQQAGIVICPGVGFDVVPTDCLAATLKRAMPDATHLTLGFDSRSSFSPGTAKTSVEGLAQGGKVRRNGLITVVPLAFKSRRIDFGNGEKSAMTIPWGDVATAFYSTGIPNIEVYIPASPRLIKRLQRLNWIRPLLGWRFVQNFMKKQIDKKVRGPDLNARSSANTAVWGEVKNAQGKVINGRMTVPNGYTLTVLSSLAVVDFLERNTASGSFTPSTLIGADFVTSLPGVSCITLS